MITPTLDRYIDVSPDLVSGKPHIAGRRITVQNIVIWHEQMGRSADEIASEHDLTLSEIYAALAYYYDHRIEIDQSIRESEQFVELLRQKTTPKLRH
jgi:uncharacterized protein (DUF433 family)